MTKLSDSEHVTERLREHIYGNIAILAALVGMEAGIVSDRYAAGAVLVTSLSLWMAAVFAAMLSQVIHTKEDPLTWRDFRKQFSIHSPILGACILPLALLSCSYFGMLSTPEAIQLSTYALVLLMVVWSFRAARAMHASFWKVVFVSAIAFAIGMVIVGLKVFVSH